MPAVSTTLLSQPAYCPSCRGLMLWMRREPPGDPRLAVCSACQRAFFVPPQVVEIRETDYPVEELARMEVPAHARS